ncbi:MAG: hypothetical protein JWM53_6800, partial [bacterium]|nr:hypothetical protein [bacterium]
MFIRYLRLFWGYAGRRLLAIVALTIVVTNVEGFGIALFFPLFAPAGGGNDSVSRTLSAIFRALHIPMSPRAVLPILAGMFLLKGVLLFALQSYQFFTGTRVTRLLRQRLVDALSRADYTYFARSNTGARTNLVVNEIPRAASGFLAFVHALPPAVNA